MGGPQAHTLLEGGARSQKTFTIIRQILLRALKAPGSRHLITRFRNNSIWPSIGMDTLPKVNRLCFPDLVLKEHKQLGYFSLPNGSEIWLGGLDDGDRVEKILGNEYATIYFNETSQIPYASVMLALTRLAQNIPSLKQRAYYDLNPTGKGHFTYAQFYEHRDPVSKQPLTNPEDYKALHMSPRGNSANLSPDYLARLENMPARQKKRFFDGEYADENENALWTYETIERNRRTAAQVPDLQAIVVAVDPSGAKSDMDLGHDMIGICVVGLGVDGHGYLLADLSLLASPAVWGKAAVAGYHATWAERAGFDPKRVQADHIVGEVNYGGAMVEFTIKSADDAVPFRYVTASRGKAVRAEPVSAIYENNKFHHVGTFPELEDELCAFSNYGYMGEGSPNRADALIWAATDLKLADDAQAWIAAMGKQVSDMATPKRPGGDDSGGLIDVYKRAFASGQPAPVSCSRVGCDEPLTNDRLTDGVHAWHRKCYSPYADPATIKPEARTQ